jgi:hypothetical protein
MRALNLNIGPVAGPGKPFSRPRDAPWDWPKTRGCDKLPGDKESHMLKAKIGKEVVARLTNQVGVLARVTKIVSEKGINIRAVSSWVEGKDAVIRLLTDDATRVADALREQQVTVKENEVVMVESPHKAGLLRSLTERLAGAGIDLRYLYASALDGQEQCLIIFGSTDNGQALALLNG